MMRWALAAALALLCAAPAHAQSADGETMWQAFLDPPADARPMVRWWWFGPAVAEAEIDREIRAMKAGGFGGFEVQPVYPLAPDGAPAGLVNLPYLSDPFLAALRHAGQTARAEGMRIDVTGGSGWPFGGPHVPVTQAAASIRMERRAAGAMLPALGPGETLLAVTPSREPGERLVFIAGRTGQLVKRAAIGAEGYVIDHIDPAAVANHLKAVGDRLLSAFDTPPDAFFSDSLEAYGSSWTGDLPAEFRRRRGYDLLEHLPALFLDLRTSAAVRFDWARTLSELVDERYLAPIDAWAKAHGTKFRAQVYGFPPPTLSSNALVALPEGEGADWRSFTSTRWATSAAHLYGKPVVSSEVWTWLHSPSWAATPLDMKMEADRHFLQGVTQLVGHGWPYTPPGVAEPGWAFYAAAALNDHNPWYAAMPDVARYLARVSWLLRQGEPANQVAIYIPTEDAFADMRPERASVNEEMQQRVPAALIAQVLDSGNGFDFIDAQAIRAKGIRHQLLVLPPMTRIDDDAYRIIAKWVAEGGHIVAVGGLPSDGGGLIDNTGDAVRALSKRLAGTPVVAQADLGAAIARAIQPEMQLAAPNPAIGFVHRRTAAGDAYFLVNSGNTPVDTRARFAGDRGNGSWWDPVRGDRRGAGTGEIAIRLAPYESRALIFAGPTQPAPAVAEEQATSLATGWTLDEHPLPAFTSWTDDPASRYFSGTRSYRRTVTLDPAGKCVAIDFGPVTPIAPEPGRRPNAAVSAPVRDVAVVLVNGRRAGSVWAPPYRLDLTPMLRAGANRIEVQVSNTALNLLAGRARPDYRLLTARYGERFQAQDSDRIVPQPSGLLGPVSLVTRSCPR
jgi:hypothetical protein